MADNKTIPSAVNIHDYISAIEDEEKKNDAFELIKIMEKATNDKGVMWGSSILGFGKYTYKYDSGREGDWMLVGFALRKSGLVVYIMDGFKKYSELLAELGKHKTGKSCLYIKGLSDINLDVLKQIINQSVDYVISKHGS